MGGRRVTGTGDQNRKGISRRGFAGVIGAGVGAGVAANWLYKERYEAGWRAEVFVGKAASYGMNLARVIVEGLRELHIGPAEVKGLKILLKPNLVEPHRDLDHINTHPLVVRAAIEAFLSLGAEQVIVAEGQGHRRDSLLVLDDSGLGEVLLEDKIAFVDLNFDSVHTVANLGGRTRLKTLAFPATLRKVDWIVSIPKLKTHHWTGVTLSMKNLFGLMPGIIYGWPKNVLHLAGIESSILDVYSTAQPHLAIVDGVVGMEGDGPIMGTPKQTGVMVIGRNFPAVDATCARIMGIDPAKVGHLSRASGSVGPIRESHISQRGESIRALRTDFSLLDYIPAQRGIRLPSD